MGDKQKKSHFGLSWVRATVEEKRESRGGRTGRRRRRRRSKIRYGILYFWVFGMNSHGELMLLGIGFGRDHLNPRCLLGL